MRVFNRDRSDEETKKLAYNYDIEQEAKMMKEIQNQKVNAISEDSLKLENRSFLNELSMLLLRTYRNSYRNPTHLKTRVFSLFIFSLVSLMLYYDLGYDYTSALSKVGFMFITLNTQLTQTMYGTLVNILAEKDVLQKEYRSKTYGIPAIYFARAVFELPIMIILGLTLFIPTYFGVNLEKDFGQLCTFLMVSL